MSANTMDWRRSELLCDADDCIRHALASRGVAQADADATSAAVIEALAQQWSGQQINFPSNYRAKMKERDQSILKRSNTIAVVDLAREFGVSERAIRKVLERAKRRQGRSP